MRLNELFSTLKIGKLRQKKFILSWKTQGEKMAKKEGNEDFFHICARFLDSKGLITLCVGFAFGNVCDQNATKTQLTRVFTQRIV